LYIHWHIVGLIAIGLNCTSMSIDGGFDDGLFDQFHLAMLGYPPQQSVRQLSQEALTAIIIVTKPSCRVLSPSIMVENVLKELTISK
jgi:hypothetical protein